MEELNESASVLALPRDVWSVIIKELNLYDTVFVRATSKWLNNLCKEFHPFPKHHVLDQTKCMAYLVENGSTSCLEYVKHALHFEWSEEQSSAAARSGRVDVLKFLRDNGCPFNNQTVLLECTKGTCDINMIKYLHESGVPWKQEDPITKKRRTSFFSGGLSERNNTEQIVAENMAFHGHLDCLKYAVENGIEEKRIWYTPSIECLDFVIANNFDWKGIESRDLGTKGIPQAVKLSICEEAAKRGDLTMLQYAHQNGAPFQDSASMAAAGGHLDCLKYILENEPNKRRRPIGAKTLECFKYLLEKLGQEVMFINPDYAWTPAVRESVEYLQYLHDINMPLPTRQYLRERLLGATIWSVDMFKFALDVLKLSFTEQSLYLASASTANLDVLKFVKERNLHSGSPDLYSPQVIANIIRESLCSKKIECLQFIWDQFPNKEGVNLEQCLHEAALMATPEILAFFTEHGAQWTSNHLVATSERGNLPAMAYLTRIGCQWNDAKCSMASPVCVKYAKEHGCVNFS